VRRSRLSRCRFVTLLHRGWCIRVAVCVDSAGRIHSDTLLPKSEQVRCADVTSTTADKVSTCERDLVPEWFRETCVHLGMAAGAPDGWATIHVKPHVPCTLLLASRFVCMGTWVGIFGGGFSDMVWYRLAPLVGFVATFTCNTAMFWRCGPSWAPTRRHNICRLLALVCLALLVIPSFVGPASMTPFGEKSYFILGGSVALWLMVIGAHLGASQHNQSPEPLTSLGPPVITATWNTVRILDPVTDMSLIRVVLNQVCRCQRQRCAWHACPKACLARCVHVCACRAPPASAGRHTEHACRATHRATGWARRALATDSSSWQA